MSIFDKAYEKVLANIKALQNHMDKGGKKFPETHIPDDYEFESEKAYRNIIKGIYTPKKGISVSDSKGNFSETHMSDDLNAVITTKSDGSWTKKEVEKGGSLLLTRSDGSFERTEYKKDGSIKKITKSDGSWIEIE